MERYNNSYTMTNTTPYKREYESKDLTFFDYLFGGAFLLFMLGFIVLVIYGLFHINREYNIHVMAKYIGREEYFVERSVLTHTSYGYQDIGDTVQIPHFKDMYEFTYNGKTYTIVDEHQYTRFNVREREEGSYREILLNDEGAWKFEDDVPSIKSFLEPYATERYKDGEYTWSAKWLQDKFEYDWELNK